jgi:hypothetical protein
MGVAALGVCARALRSGGSGKGGGLGLGRGGGGGLAVAASTGIHRNDEPQSAPGIWLGGQPLSGQPLEGQPLSGQPLDEQPLGGQTLGGQLLGGQPLGGQPLGGQLLGGQPLGGQPAERLGVTAGTVARRVSSARWQPWSRAPPNASAGAPAGSWRRIGGEAMPWRRHPHRLLGSHRAKLVAEVCSGPGNDGRRR